MSFEESARLIGKTSLIPIIVSSIPGIIDFNKKDFRHVHSIAFNPALDNPSYDIHQNKKTDTDLEHFMIGSKHYLALTDEPCCGWGRLRFFNLGGPTYNPTTSHASNKHVTLLNSKLEMVDVKFDVTNPSDDQMLSVSGSSTLNLRSTTFSSPNSLSVSSGVAYSMIDSTYQNQKGTKLQKCSDGICPGSEQVQCIDATATATSQCYGCRISETGLPSYLCDSSVLTFI
mgnify:CR=1 FL=1